MYADDTKVTAKVDNDGDRKTLQTDLDQLTDWADKWQLQFNVGPVVKI